MPLNVFVIGLDDFNLQTMQGLREAPRYDFHRLLGESFVQRQEEYDFAQLAANADRQLEEFGGQVDGIATWWDFPTTGLLPLTAELWDVPSPSLRSVLRLEHKYWSRLTQRAVAPDRVPAFAAFDPFDAGALEAVLNQGVEYPFWIKPVKSVSSYLGFRVDTAQDFEDAIPQIQEGIGRFGDPFQEALDMVDLPADIASIGGIACIAEGLIGGHQCTLEGFVQSGRVEVYGVVDSIRVEGSSTFASYQYPSRIPQPVLDQMRRAAADVVLQAGLDNACFNMEFYWDDEQGEIWLLEVNTRLSQSHADLFAKVDGTAHFRVMLDVATGRVPSMPVRRGPYPVAGKFFLRAYEDGVVEQVPSDAELAEIAERFPGTRFDIDVAPGDRLSELALQESYSYELGRVFIGASDHEELEERFERIEEELHIEIAH